ncbi:MAG: VTT domain-containing protein [Acidobacteriota bacterium]|jgi:membrane protein YqaA with SNARE-associated domain
MSLPLMYATCFGLSIVSALLPWVNSEVLLLSLSAFAHSSFQLMILVLLASAGQLLGKCILYWAGRGVIPVSSGRIDKAFNSWKDRFARSGSKSMWLVFISAVTGIPPFYVITFLAGAFRLKFSSFIAVAAAGRLLHFGILAMVPQLFTRLY